MGELADTMRNNSYFLIALCFGFAAYAQTVTTTVNAGSEPASVAVNPVTNKIYIANYAGNNVIAIDGATNSTAAIVQTGTFPIAIAVNPVTNKIYVANQTANDVTVIDGAN